MVLEETHLIGLCPIVRKSQFVSINGSNSILMRATCRVPQGCTRSIAFSYLCQRFTKCLKKLNFYLFTDDTNIYCDCNTLRTLAKLVNKEFKYVKRWLDINKLSLNISKTNYIIFHTTTMRIPTDTPIKIGRKHFGKS